MNRHMMRVDWQAHTLTPDPVHGRPVGRVRLTALVTGRGFRVVSQTGVDRTDAWVAMLNIERGPRERG